MTERVFTKPEGRETTGIEFIRAKGLFEDGVEGEFLQGTFLEAVPNRYEESKFDYKFEKEDGGITIVNHAGSLAYEMQYINPGDYCQLLYKGKEKIEKGKMKGKEAHRFEVLTA